MSKERNICQEFLAPTAVSYRPEVSAGASRYCALSRKPVGHVKGKTFERVSQKCWAFWNQLITISWEFWSKGTRLDTRSYGSSYAVQEASENIVVPIPQAIRVSFLKNYHLAMPDKTQPGHSGVYPWGTQWEDFKDQKTAGEEQTFVAEGLWAIRVGAHGLFTLWGSLSASLHS